MKILITGGAGFIGSNFIRYWLTHFPDDHILNFDSLTYAGHRESLRDVEIPEKYPNYSFFEGDITDEKTVDRVMKGIDIVVHFAAESHVDRSVIDPLLFVRTNVVGTAVLLNAALKHKVSRFHHVSTDEVFGHLEIGEKPFDEHTPLQPRTPYSSSKASSDMFAMSYFSAYGLPVTVSNCSNNYGPYQDPEKLIPRFITNLIKGDKLPLMGKGKNILDWLHVLDHCSAIAAIIQKGTPGERYCIGGDAEHTNKEVTEMLLSLHGMDDSMIEYVDDRLGHDFRYAIDSSKVRKLGWKPLHSFDTGLAMTDSWYRSNEWWWRSMMEGRPVVDRVAQKAY